MAAQKLTIKIKEFSFILWIIFVCILTISSFSIYEKYQISQKNELIDISKNIYFKKTFLEITSNLKPRYELKKYAVKAGDTYESIINKINLSKKEKQIFFQTIKKYKEIKILRPGQNLFFKIDKLDNPMLVEFTIETSKKDEMIFLRSNKNLFTSKLIQKNFTKETIYREAVITSSIYNSAVGLGINPNIILEFARLYGFQVDFQRDIWKEDSFQIIYEHYIDKNNKIVDTGEIIYANLNLQGTNLQLYRYEHETDKIDYFDENGKSVKKTLMKTPINGARLSSSFGKRKHPILGYTKMHTGTDFAAPTGTPIMASGSGIVTRAKWCGGGGNCVKIKHNSVYQTVYAHMSKFAKGIRKGARVKQGQIIGYVGSTGLSTGPHLHYEVIENGKKINSQKLKLPSGKVLKDEERKKFELSRIKIDVLKSELISKFN